MKDPVLYIGNRNYSSWSMRGWLVARLSGLEFTEQLIPLYTPGSVAQLRALSAAGQVPFLCRDGEVIWDSLALTEYLHEAFPRSGIWPQEPRARAHARCACAEMHAGFQTLRSQLPMDIGREVRHTALTAAAQADVSRIEALWSECRQRHGDGGEFLFGRWSAADCFFAPVVIRFRTYAVATGDAVTGYCRSVLEQADVRAWIEAAAAEPWVIDWDAAARTGVRPVARRRET